MKHSTAHSAVNSTLSPAAIGRKWTNQTRLALTDEALDEQFWLIDQDGIPRLKSEEGTIDLPPDSFDAIIGIFDDDITDLSTTVRETMNTYYAGKYDRPD